MIYLAYSMPDWSVIGYLSAFALPFLVFAFLGAWLLGKFHYKQIPVNKGFGVVSFVLAFLVPLIILLITLFTK